jgi:hypothetical protein
MWSRVFPSSSVVTGAVPVTRPSQRVGDREAMRASQIEGSHRAGEILRSFAGSKANRQIKRMNHKSSAKSGGIARC